MENIGNIACARVTHSTGVAGTGAVADCAAADDDDDTQFLLLYVFGFINFFNETAITRFSKIPTIFIGERREIDVNFSLVNGTRSDGALYTRMQYSSPRLINCDIY